VTDVNGLRLAYRGFVSGLAGAYVWAAIAMTLSGLIHGDPIAPLRPIATAIMPVAGSPELAFVIGLGGAQAAGGLVGMCFAYFFARFFTVRLTLGIAGPAAAVLAWSLLQLGIGGAVDAIPPSLQAIMVVAAVGYGLLLGVNVPIRGEVVRA
jgi:hypothetical protein